MRIGDEIIHDGRVLILRGLDPMSVSDGCAEVEDPETGELLRVPIAEVEPAPVPRAAAVSGHPG